MIFPARLLYALNAQTYNLDQQRKFLKNRYSLSCLFELQKVEQNFSPTCWKKLDSFYPFESFSIFKIQIIERKNLTTFYPVYVLSTFSPQ